MKIHCVKTEFGIITGRDGLVLREVSFDARAGSLAIDATLNCSLTTAGPPLLREEFKQIIINFEGVYEFKCQDLDNYEDVIKSSFDFCPIDKETGKYIVSTYDHVITVWSSRYWINASQRANSPKNGE